MKKPFAGRLHYENLTDDQLLNVDLETDDPESLPDLVRELPDGDEEPYVEYKYDLRGSGREEFTCVHGHHRHLAGFVMRKGAFRYMVGWQCAQTLYGENFQAYTADYNAAVNRQVQLRKRREIEDDLLPFLAWLENIAELEVFKQYERLRQQISGRLPWLWENALRVTLYGYMPSNHVIPHRFFDHQVDPRGQFDKIVSEMASLIFHLGNLENIDVGSVSQLKSTLGRMVTRINEIFSILEEVERCFQPAVLDALCRFATENDNPKRREYSAGPMSISCRGDKSKAPALVQVPANYRVPDRGPMDDLIARLKDL